MPLLLTYLFKLSVSLSVVYLFYTLLLRKLTFYRLNRFYFIAYTLLCFLLAGINIHPFIASSRLEDKDWVSWVPTVQPAEKILFTEGLTEYTAASSPGPDGWIVFLWVIIAGMLIMLSKALIQLWSLKRFFKKSELISEGSIRLYNVQEDIIPFTFGNAVFINQAKHTEKDLEEIIRHEFVHARQVHSLDILWAEFLCIINWFNPFAWQLRRAIRQNLEFIADDQVLQSGIEKKQYQYLLLKVIGNKSFSIASSFNFSSLKKRIAMMNKNKTAKVHLARFIFIIPLIAILLLAFRNNKSKKSDVVHYHAIVMDASSMQPLKGVKATLGNETFFSDENGYLSFTIPYSKAVSAEIIFDKNGITEKSHISAKFSAQGKQDYNNVVELVGIGNSGGYQNFNALNMAFTYSNTEVKYKDIREWFEKYKEDLLKERQRQSLFQPTDTVPPVNSKGYYIGITDNAGNCTVVVKDKDQKEVKRMLLNDWTAQQEQFEKLYGEIPSPECADLISTVRIDNGQAVIRLKDGTVENYNLTDAAQKAKLEKKYGSGILEMCQTWDEIGAPPAPPTMHNYPDTLLWIRDANREEIKEITFGDRTVKIEFKNGTKESYNLDDEKQKAAFAKKYNPTGAIIEGRIPPPPPAPQAPQNKVPQPPPAPPTVPDLKTWMGAAHKDVKNVSIQNEKVVINYKNGNVESYDLKDANQKAAFEKKYGKVEKILPAPPKPPKSVSMLDSKPDFLLTPAEKLEKEKRKNAPNGDGC